MAKTKFRFSMFGLSRRLCRGSEVMVGSKDQLRIFLKGTFVQEGSSGTRFVHGQFEIKTFPIYAPPKYISHQKTHGKYCRKLYAIYLDSASIFDWATPEICLPSAK